MPKFTLREIWTEPEELSNAELINAEQSARERIKGKSSWTIVHDRLNQVMAERERRERAYGMINAVHDLGNGSTRLADALDDAGLTLEELLEELRERRK